MEPHMKPINALNLILCLVAAALVCVVLGGCEDSQNTKKTPISGTATFPKATFQKGEKLD
jgi:uncharacterized lipoprotein YehR (DUF1307 family)